MPDIPNRDELERYIARKLGGLNRRHLARLIELLGDPPNVENVPASFWDEAGEELTSVLLPFGERVYLEAAERLLEDSVIGVDWALVNESAAQWAGQYSFELVSGINQTSRQALQRSIDNYFRDQQTIGELRDRLSNIWGPVRAEMIAVTEVTRASVQGELAFTDEIRKQGIEMVAIWQTNVDERVCPICSPLNEKERGNGWQDPPPAHPRCRCWVNHEARITEGELEFTEKP